jgi:hypothetical protein
MEDEVEVGEVVGRGWLVGKSGGWYRGGEDVSCGELW